MCDFAVIPEMGLQTWELPCERSHPVGQLLACSGPRGISLEFQLQDDLQPKQFSNLLGCGFVELKGAGKAFSAGRVHTTERRHAQGGVAAQDGKQMEVAYSLKGRTRLALDVTRGAAGCRQAKNVKASRTCRWRWPLFRAKRGIQVDVSHLHTLLRMMNGGLTR
jgi:hypothetical protein